MAGSRPSVGELYGLSDEAFERARSEAYPALKDTVYLDHAASAPIPPLVLQLHHEQVATTFLSNPHSASSQATASLVSSMRSRIMSTLFAIPRAQQSSWALVFTSGATEGCRIVGDCFDWNRGSFVYTREAHTSLVGVRGSAAADSAEVSALANDELERWLDDAESTPTQGACLFGYPAQCNATGSRLGLTVCRKAKAKRRCYVLLDAAAQLSTSTVPLGHVPLHEAPDFVVGSFYKTLGYPTGLGFLLVKRASAHVLHKRRYFGGGSVDGLTVSGPSFVVRPRGSVRTGPDDLEARFEDGTLSFASIAALGPALDVHHRLFGSLDAVSGHTARLRDACERGMASFRHYNGVPVCRIHRAFTGLRAEYLAEGGPTIAFSLVRPDGDLVGHRELESLCIVNSLAIRAGGLCATGVLAASLGLTDPDILANLAKGRACWDEEEFGGVDGRAPTGIARVSFGASSSFGDVARWLDFLRRFWTSPIEARLDAAPTVRRETRLELAEVCVYPIKSAGAFRPEGPWPLDAAGLRYDREWMLVHATTGRALSQKQYPRMALIRPAIDLAAGVLSMTFEGTDFTLSIALDATADEWTSSGDEDEVYVCADAVRPFRAGSDEAEAMFSYFLDVPCRLVRLPPSATNRHAHFDSGSRGSIPILLSNESPFLLVSGSSVDSINGLIHDEADDGSEAEVKASCFRANFVVSSGAAAYDEDRWDLVRIGPDQVFQNLAPCRRCRMVCVDQDSGRTTREPFNVLRRKRKDGKGRVHFGIHLVRRADLCGTAGLVAKGDSIAILSTR